MPALIGARRAALSTGVRAPAFDPLSLSPTAIRDVSVLSSLFQDAAATIPVTADGDPVGCIKDLTGNGYNWTESTASRRGIYHRGGGKSWVTLDGVDDTMTAALPLSGGDITLLAAVKGTNIQRVLNWQSGSYFILGYRYIGDQVLSSPDGGVSFSSNTSNNAPHVIATRRKKNVSLQAIIDGSVASIAAANANLPSVATMYLGSYAGTTEYMAGNFYADAVFIGTYLSDANFALMDKWMAGKNGAIVP